MLAAAAGNTGQNCSSQQRQLVASASCQAACKHHSRGQHRQALPDCCPCKLCVLGLPTCRGSSHVCNIAMIMQTELCRPCSGMYSRCVCTAKPVLSYMCQEQRHASHCSLWVCQLTARKQQKRLEIGIPSKACQTETFTQALHKLAAPVHAWQACDAVLLLTCVLGMQPGGEQQQTHAVPQREAWNRTTLPGLDTKMSFHSASFSGKQLTQGSPASYPTPPATPARQSSLKRMSSALQRQMSPNCLGKYNFCFL